MPKIQITDPRKDRYNTFRMISWWDPLVLQHAKIAVLGAGAVGNEVIKNLALVGIGNLLVADFDTVERANLSRSILFRERDEGRPKAEVAAEAVKQINPDVKVMSLNVDVTHEIGLGLLRRMDLVVSCLDNNEARLFVNRASWRIGHPWLDGGLDSLNGMVRVFWPGRGACFECGLSSLDYQDLGRRRSCQQLAYEAHMEGKIPTTPTAASIVGAIEVQEVLKILHGLPVPAGKSLHYLGSVDEVSWLTMAVREDCPSHETYDRIVELPRLTAAKISLRELMAIIQRATNPEAVLELGFWFATAWECQICGKREELFEPIHHLTYERSLCCGQEREVEKEFRLTGTEAFGHLSLADIGVPALEILRVNIGAEYRYFELTGDENIMIFH